MIKQKEISDIVAFKGVPKTTIDKDWVLGHFLNAFYSFSQNQSNFIFKGGTCMHKCYIEDYRFSEYLDFTLVNKDFVVDKSFVNEVIKKAEINKISWNRSLSHQLSLSNLDPFTKIYSELGKFIYELLNTTKS